MAEEEEAEATLLKIVNTMMNPRRTSNATIAISLDTINPSVNPMINPRKTSNATTTTSLGITNPSATRSKGRRIKQVILKRKMSNKHSSWYTQKARPMQTSSSS